jgi:hypothetical protein
MKKADRMEHFIRELQGQGSPPAGSFADSPDPFTGQAGAPSLPSPAWPPAYAGYFVCFNRGEFYEAHDVLEHLWLRTDGFEAGFYKGLIQVAGGFVHLRKHYLRPLHHKDGLRLAPAGRLFQLALGQFQPYPGFFLGLDLDALRTLCREMIRALEVNAGSGGSSGNGPGKNPWRPETSPLLQLHPPLPQAG